MRRATALAATVAALVLLVNVAPVAAQSITGISVRPAEAAPTGSVKGWADILEENGSYKVSVDLSSNVERLRLSSFSNAEAFVVWAVDMEGMPHNIGVLDEDLKLESAKVDFVVARLIVTAEPEADAASMSGQPLFECILRQVELKVGAPIAPAAPASQQLATKQPTAAAVPTATPTAEPTKPTELPTTGSVAQDLAVLAMLAAALLALGLRLRTVHF